MTDEGMRRLAAEMTPQRFVLPNGLTVLVSEMPAYRGVHAVYAVRFGALDTDFLLDGRRVHLPAGTAHFLEHKMFEDEAGVDAFALYAATGASANAYTTLERTCYVFTATDRVQENLDILLRFVSQPYFSDKTVAKEQGIITQEINMYRDSPGSRLLYGLLCGLYRRHPVRHEVTGSARSIRALTPALLYDCCAAFYTPGNMVLSVAGNVRAQQVLAAAARMPAAAPPRRVRRLPHASAPAVWRPRTVLHMQLAQPLWGIGYKLEAATWDTLRGEVLCDLVCELLTGDTSPFYKRIYDEGLITEELSGEYLAGGGSCALLFTAVTRCPERLEQAFLAEAARLCREGVGAEQFECAKNLLLGDMITDTEDVEAVADGQAAAWMRGHTLFDEVQTLCALRPADVQAALPALLDGRRSAVVTVLPSRPPAGHLPMEEEEEEL